MKLAVSNIAWPAEENDAVAKLLVAERATGIEVAPTKLFPRPLEASEADIDACRAWWQDRGLPIVAAQALLFGQPGLTIFENTEARTRTREYLTGIIRVCARLGAEALVFGSPKNRAIGARLPHEVHDIAIEFFHDLGQIAQNEGTHLVLEAIPPENGGDYVTRASEAIALIRDVAHPGFQLHLDTACMTLAKDNIAETFASGCASLRHFHVSEPALAAIGSGSVEHHSVARELRKHLYEHWVSIEMREATPFSQTALAESLRLVRQIYGDAS